MSRHAISASLPHFLYRCYDADGDLIYIGCTANVKKRMAAHRRGDHAKASKWLSVFMVRHEVEGPFPDRATALAAEAEAITREQPVFNTQERRVPSTRTNNDVARYLVERGHRDLAIATVCTCWQEDREAGTTASWCVAHRIDVAA